MIITKSFLNCIFIIRLQFTLTEQVDSFWNFYMRGSIDLKAKNISMKIHGQQKDETCIEVHRHNLDMVTLSITNGPNQAPEDLNESIFAKGLAN